MKIGKMMTVVTFILIALYGITIFYIHKTDMKGVDVIRINNIVKTIEGEFEKQQYQLPKTGVIDDMSYIVVFSEDQNYDSTVFHAIKNRSAVVDLTDTTDYEVETKIIGKVIFQFDNHEEIIMKKNLMIEVTVLFLVLLIFSYMVYGRIYVRIIKPFAIMKQFAGKVAEGDLEFGLLMDKNNYFGAFTESFDIMREQLMRARQGEYEANISKKELVAELSHDIKTPVATIKAICELLEVKLNNVGNNTCHNETPNEDLPCVDTYQRTNRESIEKIEVIYHKADIIDRLISNMFHATLEELEMLKVVVSEQPSTIITQMFLDSNHFHKITLKNSIAECLIKCDPLRFSQVIDNVISNSYKYAGTDIDVSFTINKPEKNLVIRIRDYGNGVNENELELICEKFYRGSDEKVKNSAGSGLGLYLSRKFMEGMGGNFTCYNESGFVVELVVRIV